MSKEDIINYVMTTPNNPNRAVLEGMLEDVSKDGSTPMIVRMDTEGTADKTWQQVYDALADGTLVYVLSSTSNVETDAVIHAPILMAVSGNGSYRAIMILISLDEAFVQTTTLVTDSADSYLRAITDAG